MMDGAVLNSYVNMRRCVVNLPGYGITELYSYFNGYVYGVCCENSRKFRIAVDTGIITIANEQDVKLIFQPDEYHHIEDVSYQIGCGKFIDDITLELTIRLLSTLVSHRVGGDDILKGLKASIEAEGIPTDDLLQGWKVKENYLGGWLVSRGDTKSSVNDLVCQVYNHLMGVKG